MDNTSREILEELYRGFLEEKRDITNQIDINAEHLSEIMKNLQVLSKEDLEKDKYFFFSPRQQHTAALSNSKKYLYKDELDRKNQLENNNQLLYKSLDSISQRIGVCEKLLNVSSSEAEQEYIKNFHILSIQEMDRNRIARELHDTTIQNLVHMIHKIEVASKFIDQDPIRSKLELSTISKNVKEIIDDMRNLVYDLRPMSFDDLGFEITLNRFFESITEETEIEIVFDNSSDFEKFNSIYLLTLFRILQECVVNSVRHSGATQIDVSIKEEGKELIIKIKDNGVGCNETETEKKHHFGLQILKERVLLLSGSYNFEFGEGMGFETNIVLPIE